jgi:hypothetical protein
VTHLSLQSLVKKQGDPIMRDAITVYAIELSESKRENEFETFMLNEIFPTVHKEPTRSGQITRLVLLKGNVTNRSHEYLWLVSGEDLIDGGAARQKIEEIKAFGAQVSLIQDFRNCGSWSAENELEPEIYFVETE